MAYTVRNVIQNREPVLKCGDTYLTVLRKLGRANEKLADNVWVYRGFHGSIAQADERGCNTLVITFARNRISNIKLVNDSAHAVMAARLKDNPLGQDGVYVVRK